MKEKYKKALNEEIKVIKITEKTKELAQLYPHLYRGSVRLYTGEILTAEEYEKQRGKIDLIALP